MESLGNSEQPATPSRSGLTEWLDSLVPKIGFDEWVEKYLPGITLDPWQVEFFNHFAQAERDRLERAFRDEPVDLDTWEGEGGALAAEKPSGPMRGLSADLIIIDEAFIFTDGWHTGDVYTFNPTYPVSGCPDAAHTIAEQVQSLPDVHQVWVNGCKGCRGCSDIINWDDPPPACTRYPVCDDPELPDHEACIWPSCNENYPLTPDP